jgi:hypothetical protein
MIPIAPHGPSVAVVAFALYRVYRTPRPSSEHVSRISLCPTETNDCVISQDMDMYIITGKL